MLNKDQEQQQHAPTQVILSTTCLEVDMSGARKISTVRPRGEALL